MTDRGMHTARRTRPNTAHSFDSIKTRLPQTNDEAPWTPRERGSARAIPSLSSFENESFANKKQNINVISYLKGSTRSRAAREMSWFTGSASWAGVPPLVHEAPPILLLWSPVEELVCWGEWIVLKCHLKTVRIVMVSRTVVKLKRKCLCLLGKLGSVGSNCVSTVKCAHDHKMTGSVGIQSPKTGHNQTLVNIYAWLIHPSITV